MINSIVNNQHQPSLETKYSNITVDLSPETTRKVNNCAQQVVGYTLSLLFGVGIGMGITYLISSLKTPEQFDECIDEGTEVLKKFFNENCFGKPLINGIKTICRTCTNKGLDS